MKKSSKRESLPLCAVLLAGGRGTRFWPRSRMRTPKQLLNITGGATMLRETVKRLESVVPLRNMWVVTNVEQAAAVRREMRGSPSSQVLAEPVGRNTAAAIGLAAVHLAHEHGDALMAVLPSDSYIADGPGYRKLVRAALELAQTPGNLVVLGVPPTRPETGYGYIERGALSAKPNGRRGVRFAPLHGKAGAEAWRRNMWRRGNISGTPGCSSGASLLSSKI